MKCSLARFIRRILLTLCSLLASYRRVLDAHGRRECLSASPVIRSSVGLKSFVIRSAKRSWGGRDMRGCLCHLFIALTRVLKEFEEINSILNNLGWF